MGGVFVAAFGACLIEHQRESYVNLIVKKCFMHNESI